MDTGVYTITNIKTKQVYVGSSRRSIEVRLNNHKWSLRKGIHKNIKLQNSFNKYGEDCFLFEVLELCDVEFCLSTEQYWMNMTYCTFKEYGFNINPLSSGLPHMDEEAIERRKEKAAKKRATKEKLRELRAAERKAIKNERAREKRKERIIKNNIPCKEPWNKGKKYESTDHLKTPKKKKGSRDTFKETMRNRLPMVEVYDKDMNFIEKFNSVIELKEFSEQNANYFPIEKRKSARVSKTPDYVLYNANVLNCAKKGKPYKGLFFKLIEA